MTTFKSSAYIFEVQQFRIRFEVFIEILFCGHRWKTVSQSECSAQCGPGTRTQSVACVQESHKGVVSQLPDSKCSHLPKPPDTVVCIGQCLESKWSFTEWTPVSFSFYVTL